MQATRVRAIRASHCATGRVGWRLGLLRQGEGDREIQRRRDPDLAIDPELLLVVVIAPVVNAVARKEFKQKYGDTISSQEFVVAHEVGHDVAHQETKAFEAMTKATGWKKVKVDELRKDHVSEHDIERLDNRADVRAVCVSDVVASPCHRSPVARQVCVVRARRR